MLGELMLCFSLLYGLFSGWFGRFLTGSRVLFVPCALL